MNVYDRFETDDLPLFDVFEPISPSRAAKQAIKEKLPELRARVYDRLAVLGEVGATDEQLQDSLGMEPNTQRPRRYELVKMGLVTDSGRRRPLKSGKMGTVWQVVKR